MIQIGYNITAKGDKLTKADVNFLYDKIKNPDTKLRSLIQRLRTIATIDEKKYRQQKVLLPYFTCGIFNPPFRKTDNFASISCFVIDIDHITKNGFDINTLKNTLTNDDRIMLMFVSPGSDGLKLVFGIDKKCYDRNKYSLFYKLFVQKFAAEKNLTDIVDIRTHDVTRACFLSFDPDIYYNPKATLISIQSVINFENPNQVFEAQKLIDEDKKNQNKHLKKNDENKELPEDVLFQIKQKLNPNIRTKPKKNIYVPKELNAAIDKITKKANELNINILSVDNINYGKKVRFAVNDLWAELNVFYGKKGFSVVKTPKRNSNKDLAEIAYQMICEVLFDD